MMKFAFALAVAMLAGGVVPATAKTHENAPDFAARIASVVARPAFAHASIGMEFLDLDTGVALYARNGASLFVPGSTTKLLTEGAVLHALGPDYRFHTRVYRTGDIAADGTLQGQLVVIPSGDPDISGRARKDGTYAFQDEDHSYGGAPVDGDPLAAVDDLADQIASHGIKKITGDVVVQTGFFPQGDTEGGTGTTISPVCLNDNIIDMQISAAAAPGSPAAITVAPFTSYLTLVNRTVTGARGSKDTIDWSSDVANPNGTRTLTVRGSLPADAKPAWSPYAVQTPDAFLRSALVDALLARGVAVMGGANAVTGGNDYALYSPANRFAGEEEVADHVSLPLAQDVRITLKVSQNLHAATMPYVLGALVGGDHNTSLVSGFGIERAWLAAAKLDLAGAAQSDGEGADAYFSPDFMVHFLAFERTQPEFWAFHAGLPVLGRDGTLAAIQRSSPAAGHVAAKTGTFEDTDYLNGRWMVRGKGLAGYFTSRSGKHIAFAVYLNNVSVATTADATNIAGQACGEIAALGYLYL
jgi:PBP4 family serine-type D-alanyl-D-alanine carboxypeptidase